MARLFIPPHRNEKHEPATVLKRGSAIAAVTASIISRTVISDGTPTVTVITSDMTIISPSDLSHHRTYRSVYGGSINLTCDSLFGVVVFHGYKTKLS